VAVAAVLAGLLAGSGASAPAAGSARALRGGAPPAAARTALPTSVAADQLSVAAQLGPDIVAAWVVHAGDRLHVQLWTLTGLEQPTALAVALGGAANATSCGTGCRTASLPGAARTLAVRARIDGGAYSATLPVAFDASGDALAARLLRRMDAGQERLRSAAVYESLASSPAPADITSYRIVAPDRFAYSLSRGGRPVDDTVIVGTREWDRAAGSAVWRPSSYGSAPFSASAYLDWWASYGGQARLLDLERTASGTVADVARLTEIAGLGPVWFRFRIDVGRAHLQRLSMITVEHFMSQAWSGFDQPTSITAPSAG
jgi:hypothetical protein